MKITYEIKPMPTGKSTYRTIQGDPARRFMDKVKQGQIPLFTDQRLILIKELRY